MQTKSPRQTFYNDRDFTVQYEEAEGFVALHCNVRRFSPSVLKQMYFVFAALEDHFRNAGYKRMVSFTPNEKFCELFNGQSIQSFEYEGKKHEVILWELK